MSPDYQTPKQGIVKFSYKLYPFMLLITCLIMYYY